MVGLTATGPRIAPSCDSSSVSTFSSDKRDSPPSSPLFVQDPMPALLATDGIALVDADLDAALGTEVVHGRARGVGARVRGVAA
jgi:hypothetical protein